MVNILYNIVISEPFMSFYILHVMLYYNSNFKSKIEK